MTSPAPVPAGAFPSRMRCHYFLLGALYTSQYLGLGFLAVAATSILRTQGLSLDAIAALSTLGLLWGAKLLWAPLVDRLSLRGRGHYRSWLLLLQPLLAATLLGMAAIPDLTGHFGLLTTLMAGYVVLAATQDIAVDGLAVSTTPPAYRATVNGIQVGGSFLGNLIGGGVTALVYDLAGWSAALVFLAVLTVLPLPAVLALREPARTAEHTRIGVREIARVVRQPGAGLWAFVALPLMWGGLTAGYSLVNPALIDAGWSVAETGTLLAILGSGVAALASLGLGPLMRGAGRVRALVAATALTALGLLAFAPVMGRWAPAGFVVAAVVVFFTAYAAVSSYVSMVNMDYSRQSSPGTDFTALSSVSMIVAYAAGALALLAAGSFGYLPVLLCALALFVLGAVLTVAHQRRQDTASLNRPLHEDTPDPAQTQAAA